MGVADNQPRFHYVSLRIKMGVPGWPYNSGNGFANDAARWAAILADF